MENTQVLSVGIDIGTSTTKVIFSRLVMENTAGFFTVPRISIVEKEVIYRSDIYHTPLKTASLLDGEAVREIVAGEFVRAGLTQADIGTGAVIITGESARKENAGLVLAKLSDFAGDFVVSTAGPDLEAVIAGQGSGAQQDAEENAAVVVNLDIGGGTTNVVLFDQGQTAARGCVDIGGRLIRVEADLTVTYASESARKIARALYLPLQAGERTTLETLTKICDTMARLLEQLLGLEEQSGLLREIQTPGSTWFAPQKKIAAICFSGGVADCIYQNRQDPLQYGDIGVLLGRSIRRGRLFQAFRVLTPKETIRATVVGAGTYTTSISGSTIDYTEGLFPLKNVPVLKLSLPEQARCFAGDSGFLKEKVRWFLQQSDSTNVILAMQGEKNPSYAGINILAATIVAAMDTELPEGSPLLLVVESDMAKALGQAVKKNLSAKRPVIAIDAIRVEQNDFVDMGKPLMQGLVIPVVVKTLIFG